MEITDEHRRAARVASKFFTDGYLAAVERISSSPPVYESAEGSHSTTSDGTVLDHRDMGEFSPAEAREHAYELLVLADLVEGPGGTER